MIGVRDGPLRARLWWQTFGTEEVAVTAVFTGVGVALVTLFDARTATLDAAADRRGLPSASSTEECGPWSSPARPARRRR